MSAKRVTVMAAWLAKLNQSYLRVMSAKIETVTEAWFIDFKLLVPDLKTNLMMSFGLIIHCL